MGAVAIVQFRVFRFLHQLLMEWVNYVPGIRFLLSQRRLLYRPAWLQELPPLGNAALLGETH